MMWFKSKKSPFSAPDDPKDLGLGCQRREKRRLWVGRVSRFLGYMGGFAAVVWMLQGGIQMFLEKCVWNNPSLALRKFNVHSHGVIPPRLLIQWTGLNGGDNLLSFHLAEIKRNLELSPFVAEASVERVFPETLSIHVRERKPNSRIQLLQLNGQSDGNVKLLPLLLDEEGVVMSMPTQGEIPLTLRLQWQQLPEITGISGIKFHIGKKVSNPGMVAAVQWISTFQNSVLNDRVKILSVSVSEENLLRVTTKDGQQILFAYDDVEMQLSKWMQILDFGRQIGKRLVFLDLTIPNNMPFEWAPEEALKADERRHRIQPFSLNHVDV